MPLASHIQLPERYRVTRHIASGGMASVWEVEDLLLVRVVAVKVLGAHYAADSGARARFAREARTAARVCEHPNIATIYDVGEHAENAFIVMEYFSGGTLADRLRAASDGGDRVPRATALRWLREAAGALDFAHSAAIVHRDVKPANLLLDAQQRLAVGDFGIARLADDTHMTQTGQVLGTAAYLSPEQALGRPATPASDRYALAVIAFELLTGTRPFAGGPPTAQARQHAEAQPARASAVAPGLPPAIDAVLARGLAKQPSERPASAAELVTEIERGLRERRPIEPTRPLAAVVVAPDVPVAEPDAGQPRRIVPVAPPPEPPAQPDDRPSPPRHPRRVSPLVPIGLAALVAGVVLALVLSGGGDGDGAREAASSTPRTTAPARERTQATAPATATQPAPSEPGSGAQSEPEPGAQSERGSAAAAAAEDPAALNKRGYDLSQDGDYAAAVPILRNSVEGYRSAKRTKELGYAFALYNLAFALTRSGDPGAAIDLLQERLKYRNQLDTVREELANARAQLDGGAETAPGNDRDEE